MQIRLHRKLDVWKMSMDFVKDIYRLPEVFPASETFGMVSQMRRASISILSNFAEGAARKGIRTYLKIDIS